MARLPPSGPDIPFHSVTHPAINTVKAKLGMIDENLLKEGG